jgi:hypothetical protein
MDFQFAFLGPQHAYESDCNYLAYVAERPSPSETFSNSTCTVPVSVDGSLSSSHALNDGVPWGAEWGAPPSHRPSRLQNDQCTYEIAVTMVFGMCAVDSFISLTTTTSRHWGGLPTIARKALAPHLKLQPNDFTSASASRMDSHLSYIGNAGTFLFGQGTLVLYFAVTFETDVRSRRQSCPEYSKLEQRFVLQHDGSNSPKQFWRASYTVPKAFAHI